MSRQIRATASRDYINQRLPWAPRHLRPILLAVRDSNVGWATVTQRSGRFDLPRCRPSIVVIGDDLDISMGPDGFHRKSIRRALARCKLIAVVASEALPGPYEAAARMAADQRRDAMVIETRPEHEMHWLALVHREAPAAKLIIATTRGRGH